MVTLPRLRPGCPGRARPALVRGFVPALVRGLLLALVLTMLTACGSPNATGGTPPPTTPPAGPTAAASAPANPASSPTTTPTESAMTTSFTIASPAFADGTPIPKRHTCDGADVSPTLTWEGAPDGTAAFALIVDDPDAPRGTFVHWVAFDIDGVPDGGLAEGISRTADAPPEGRNDFGRIGYGGPCPPPGPTHHYRFTLYALDRRLGLRGSPTTADLRAAMSGHVLVEARLVGTFRR